MEGVWGGRMGDGERWVDITHGGKSLHIASWDIGTVMFQGFLGDLNIASNEMMSLAVGK